MIVREFPKNEGRGFVIVRMSAFVILLNGTDPAARYEVTELESDGPRGCLAACTSWGAATAASRLLNGYCAEDLAAARATVFSGPVLSIPELP